MLVISSEEVRELLDLDALIDALAHAMADLSAGQASVPPRIGARVDEAGGILGAMPGYVPSIGALVCKLVSVFPRNDGIEVPTHQAMIAVFDPTTGTPVALLDGTEITAVRTGAGSALSARLLAGEDASVLAILGTGVQARSHARAMVRVRRIAEIRVAGRHPEKVRALAGEIGATACDSYEEACDGADIVSATTHTHEPIVRRAWLSPGTHVTSVGWNAEGREVDDETVADALVCVESRATVLATAPAGSPDVAEPIAKRLISEDDVVEVGELVAGTRQGRADPDQLTLYKSVGVAVQDAAAAALVVAAARHRGMGREIDL